MQAQQSARSFCAASHSSATLTSSLVAGRPSAGGRRATAAGYQPSCLPRACGTRTRSLTASRPAPSRISGVVAGRPSAGGRRTTAAGYLPFCLPRACGTCTRAFTASRPAPTRTFGAVAGRPSAGGRRTTAAGRRPLRILRALVQSQRCVEHLERDAEFPLRFFHRRCECKVPTVRSVASHVAARGFTLPGPALFVHTRNHEIQSLSHESPGRATATIRGAPSSKFPPNHSIERTPKRLRLFVAAHVKR